MSDPRTLPQLPEATQANEADLLLLRQGIFDKHVAVSTLLAPARADATQGVQAQADRLRLTALTGGGSGALDAIPWGECVDNELAVVEIAAGVLGLYRFDKNSTAAESSPSVIKPDNAGANPGRWLQRGTVGEAELWDALYAHEARTDNPHGVTREQLGAASAADLAALAALVGQAGAPIGTLDYNVIPGYEPPLYAPTSGQITLRADYPELWALAQAGAVSEAEWANDKQGCFSTGDGATTFRWPLIDAEFVRALDRGRGVDMGRVFGSLQLDAMQEHSHTYSVNINTLNPGATHIDTPYDILPDGRMFNTSTQNGRIASETRPRNIAYPAWIKYA